MTSHLLFVFSPLQFLLPLSFLLPTSVVAKKKKKNTFSTYTASEIRVKSPAKVCESVQKHARVIPKISSAMNYEQSCPNPRCYLPSKNTARLFQNSRTGRHKVIDTSMKKEATKTGGQYSSIVCFFQLDLVRYFFVRSSANRCQGSIACSARPSCTSETRATHSSNSSSKLSAALPNASPMRCHT